MGDESAGLGGEEGEFGFGDVAFESDGDGDGDAGGGDVHFHGEGVVEPDGAGEFEAGEVGADAEVFVGDFSVGEVEGDVGDVAAGDVEDVADAGDGAEGFFDVFEEGGVGVELVDGDGGGESAGEKALRAEGASRGMKTEWSLKW